MEMKEAMVVPFQIVTQSTGPSPPLLLEIAGDGEGEDGGDVRNYEMRVPQDVDAAAFSELIGLVDRLARLHMKVWGIDAGVHMGSVEVPFVDLEGGLVLVADDKPEIRLISADDGYAVELNGRCVGRIGQVALAAMADPARTMSRTVVVTPDEPPPDGDGDEADEADEDEGGG